jgi:ABC-2 type transport system permease protein
MASGVNRVGRSRRVAPPPPPPPAVRVREGSPWTGLSAVIMKEMADHLTSVRMFILELLIVVIAGGLTIAAINNVRSTISSDQFLFLNLFSSSDPNSQLPAFIELLPILVPLLAIILVFDSINGEFSKRTMSRILAQPIYRDALLLGKYLAALFTLGLVLTVIWLLIIGMGLLRLAVPPTGEQVLRMFCMLLLTIFYGGIWIALGMVFSVAFRSPATAMLASIAIWFFFFFMWDTLITIVAQALSSDAFTQAQLQLSLGRFSPNTLYGVIITVLLNPTVRSLSLGYLVFGPPPGALANSPLSVGQSLLVVWPEITGLIAATILLFALAYVLFQRQEIRA